MSAGVRIPPTVAALALLAVLAVTPAAVHAGGCYASGPSQVRHLHPGGYGSYWPGPERFVDPTIPPPRRLSYYVGRCFEPPQYRSTSTLYYSPPTPGVRLGRLVPYAPEPRVAPSSLPVAVPVAPAVAPADPGPTFRDLARTDGAAAWALLARGEAVRALGRFTVRVHVNPADARARAGYALAAALYGDDDAAATAMTRALALDPDVLAGVTVDDDLRPRLTALVTRLAAGADDAHAVVLVAVRGMLDAGSAPVAQSRPATGAATRGDRRGASAAPTTIPKPPTSGTT
ncbi:MAG: hypothetical protein ACYTG1_10120 [Planctomycetota bacterium]|jgi:hypothetical protein